MAVSKLEAKPGPRMRMRFLGWLVLAVAVLLAGLHGWLYAQHFERSALELFRPGLKAR